MDANGSTIESSPDGITGIIRDNDASVLQRPRGNHVCAPHGSLVAIADLHGDIVKAKEVLRLLCVVDDEDNWQAEGITVVQLGDLVDRGADSLDLLNYMHTLQDQAKQHNSSLVLLTGNHELANLQGDFRYVSTEEVFELGKAQKLNKKQEATHTFTVQHAISQRVENSEPDNAGSSSHRGVENEAVEESSLSDIDAYLEGVKVWAAIWQVPQPQVSAGSAGQDAVGMVTPPTAAAGPSEESEHTLGGTGVVRSSIAAHHQLLTVQGQGTPCATAFVHAGLLPRVLHKLRKLAAAHSDDNSRVKGAEAAGGEEATSKAQQEQQQEGSRIATADDGKQQVAVGVVSADELERLNKMFLQAVSVCDDEQCSSGSNTHPSVQQLWSLVGSQQGPLWNRQQAQGQESGVCRSLDQVLRQLGVQRLVVGHTPQQAGRVVKRCGGKLVLLDTGMSSGMLDSPAAAWVCSPIGVIGRNPAQPDTGSSLQVGNSLSSTQTAKEIHEGAAEQLVVLKDPVEDGVKQVADANDPDTGQVKQLQLATGTQQEHQQSAVVYADGVLQPLQDATSFFQ